MTVQELYDKASKYNLLDEKVEEVIEYFGRFNNESLTLGVCASCRRRKTDECPWSDQCGLSMPICCSFKHIEFE